MVHAGRFPWIVFGCFQTFVWNSQTILLEHRFWKFSKFWKLDSKLPGPMICQIANVKMFSVARKQKTESAVRFSSRADDEVRRIIVMLSSHIQNNDTLDTFFNNNHATLALAMLPKSVWLEYRTYTFNHTALVLAGLADFVWRKLQKITIQSHNSCLGRGRDHSV